MTTKYKSLVSRRVSGKQKRHRNLRLIRYRVFHFLHKHFPLTYRFFFGKTNDLKTARKVVAFPFGVLLGYVFSCVFVPKLDVTPIGAELLSVFIIFMCSVGYALSVQIRCICWLMIPTMCTRYGRAMLVGTILAALAAGPIANIIYNVADGIHVILCLQRFQKTIMINKFKLMFEPIKEIFENMWKSNKEVKNTVKDVKELMRPYKEEVEGGADEEEKMKADSDYVDQKQSGGKTRTEIIESRWKKTKAKSEPEKIFNQFAKKTEFRCNDVFTMGAKKCYKLFEDAEKRCLDKIPVVGWLICWPMQLKKICDVMMWIVKKFTCDSKNAVHNGFGEQYALTKEVVNGFDQNFDAKIKYKLAIPEQKVDMLTPEDIAKMADSEISRRKEYFEAIMLFLYRLLIMMFFLIVLGARTYNDRYLTEISFDNTYVTDYFRHIDARRKRRGKVTLLPLKRAETTELSDALDLKMTPGEKTIFYGDLWAIIGHMLSATVFVVMDSLLYDFLETFRMEGLIEYDQKGVHEIKLFIFGKGIMAKFVKSILSTFNKKKVLNFQSSTEHCLPSPVKTDPSTLTLIYGLYGLTVLVIVLEAYITRTRRLIAGYFYPKHSKRRIIHLYNERLRKRKSYLHYMRRRLRKLHAKKTMTTKETHVVWILANKYPRWFGWLKAIFKDSRRKCIVCEEPEKTYEFHTCPNPDCESTYCDPCWKDVKHQCWACAPYESEDSSMNSDID